MAAKSAEPACKAESQRVPPGRRESQTQLWLELLRDDCGIAAESISPIWREADELIAIFVTMSKNTKDRQGRGRET